MKNYAELLTNEAPLHEEEELLISTIFQNPTLLRYLRVLAQNEVADFVSSSVSTLEDPAYAKQLANLQGKLAVLQHFISLNKKEF